MNAKTDLSLARELFVRREIDQAIESYRKIIIQDDKNTHAFIGLGKSYFEKAMWEESLYYFLRAEVIEPSQEVYQNIGNLFFKKENFKKALEYYEKALKIGKPGYEILIYKGFVCEKLKLKKEAVRVFIEAYYLKPEKIELCYKIAPLALEAEFFQEAADFYQILLKQQENSLYYAELGLAYMRLGNYEDSKKCYQKAKEMTLKSRPGINFKEMTFDDFVAKYPKIDEQIKETRNKINSGDTEYRNHMELGNMLFIKGDYQSALESYLKAREGFLSQMMAKPNH